MDDRTHGIHETHDKQMDQLAKIDEAFQHINYIKSCEPTFKYVSDALAKQFRIKQEELEEFLMDKFLNRSYEDHFSEKNHLPFYDTQLPNAGKSSSKWVFSFEGIDATGKQSLSGLLEDYFKYLFYRRHFGKAINNINILDTNMNNCTKKFNIPDYNLESGQEIAEILSVGDYNPEVLQLKFALNRKEVQNKIDLDTKLQDMVSCQPFMNALIFDRWVDSGAMYRLAKDIYQSIKDNFKNDILLDSLFENFDHTHIERFINNENIKTFKHQIKLEHVTLGLVKPHVKFLCTTDIDVIAKRIIERAKANGVNEEDLDSHEKDLNFLKLTQSLYIYIYSNPKSFFQNDIFTHGHKNYKIIDTTNTSKEDCLVQVLSKLINSFGLDHIN